MRRFATRGSIAVLGLLVLAAAAWAGTGAWLGVYTRAMDEALHEALDFDEDGILVEDVVEGSPADEAGIETGDILVRLEGKALTSTSRLRRVLAKLEPGNEAILEIWRDGDSKEVIVKPGEAKKPSSHFLWKQGEGEGGLFSSQGEGTVVEIQPPSRTWLGIALEELNEQLGAYFGVEDGEGVLVTEVMEESPAEEAGLLAGDVIVALGGEKVVGAGDVHQGVHNREPGEEVEIEVIREKERRTLTATLGEKEFFAGKSFQFRPGEIEVMVKEAWQKAEPQVRRELERLREEMKELKVKVDNLSE